MWKLPNGKTISVPKDVTIGNVCYPAQIFRRWTKEELNAHGIKPFREVSYDSRYFRSIGSTEVETNGEIIREHALTPRYTNQEVRNVFKVMIKQHLRANWQHAKEEHEYLQTFEPENTEDIATWAQYSQDLRQAATDIKAAFQATTSYEEGIEFIKHGYTAMLPTLPFQEGLTP
jgi:hypothetical protein